MSISIDTEQPYEVGYGKPPMHTRFFPKTIARTFRDLSDKELADVETACNLAHMG